MLCNEFDPDRKALIDPQEQFRPIAGFPEICVMAFSAHIVEKCLERYGGEQIADVPFCTCLLYTSPFVRKVRSLPAPFGGLGKEESLL